jgi:predicted metal-dependent phosphoesterase TrpH
VIDLHTHTTASDGRCAPQELVARAGGAGVTVLSVTDHDTVAGCEAAAAACAAAGIEFVAGIEITAVRDDVDVHMLGYFVDPASPALLGFLTAQRQQRIDRIREMVAKLAIFGIRLDADAIVQPAIDDPGRSVGRPWIARALVAGGHVKSTNEAFGIWLSRGRPAFVPRESAPPADVIERVHEAGGIASIAHPGLVGHDEWIAPLAEAGLDAIEVYHTDHDRAATARYRALADRLNLLASGGSDFHGDPSHGATSPGAVTLPREDFDRLAARATARRR